MSSNVYLILGAILALSSFTSAFFWDSSEKTTPAPHIYFIRKLHPGAGPGYQYIGEAQHIPQIPSIPKPIEPQVAPLPNQIQDVQFVPCLCPVQQDYPYSQPQPDPVYLNAIPVQRQLSPNK